MIEKTNWYKEKDVSEDEEVKPGRKEGESRRGKRKIEYTSEEDAKRRKKVDAKTVIFCPYTKGGELAKQLREAEENMEKATGYRMKIVEEIGEKVIDKLHSSNPWRGEDCKREGCILCETKVMTGKGKKQDCHKRSVVYETWCETCYRQEERRIEEEEVEDTEKELRKKKIRVHKYIGETARSAYERGMEHRLALEKMDEDSHMMKHVATYHKGEEIEEVKFGMRVVSFCRTPLERQVLESVKIQEERQKNITMNSRSEYSRSKIPRLTAKMGDDEYDERRENEKKEDKLIEENVRKEIYRRRKEKCKKRSKEIHEHKERIENNNFKKRRIDEEGKYKTVIVREVEKREEVIEEEEKVLERKKKKPNPPGKILGGVIKGMELANEIDWQKRREEIIEMMRKDEEERRKRIEKATKLQKSWELVRECSRILEEGLSTWKTRSEREDDMVEANERAERIGRANAKKMEYRKKEEIKDKCRKITDMFKEVPRTEAQRMAAEIRKEEKAELEKLKEMIWKKWRGKKTVLERKNIIPSGEKLDKKLLEVEKRVMEYKNKKEEQLKKRDRKKKEWKERNKMIVEDTWGMLRWLTQYIEENEYDWSRRKEMEKEESKKEKNRWAGMEDEDLIRQVMEQEMHEKVEEESRKERADRRKRYWKDWRGTVDEEEILENVIGEKKKKLKAEEDRTHERLEVLRESRERRKRWEIAHRTGPPNSSSSQDPPLPSSSDSSDTPQQTQLKIPDNGSHNNESNAKGLPPVLVDPSVDHKHEGCLGGVTLRGGVVPSPTPPPSQYKGGVRGETIWQQVQR